MLNATTGWNISTKEAMKIGERIWNLQKLYNIREGASRTDDTLPERIREHAVPFPDGKRRAAPDLAPMLDEYYELRGWDREGKPTELRLRELGLSSSL
jgi:aldehyde:ferredoxin oxidoreductase